ncbi:MAG: retropepsin-like domain-containing protein [Bacteroidia bacterium]|nr:retropepsin-like domain-containing protein [Bacteroidia bacterium]
MRHPIKNIPVSICCLFLVFFTQVAMISPSGHEVKVVSFRPKPIVKGMINGRKTYFLLDTGADISLLNIEAQQDYGFETQPVIGEHHIQGVEGKRQQVKATKKAEIYLGPQKIKSRILAFNMNHVVEGIYGKTGVKISGIIGSDIMRKYGFVIDYSTNKVLIQKSK